MSCSLLAVAEQGQNALVEAIVNDPYLAGKAQMYQLPTAGDWQAAQELSCSLVLVYSPFSVTYFCSFILYVLLNVSCNVLCLDSEP